MPTQFVTVDIEERDGRFYHQWAAAKVITVPDPPETIICKWCGSHRCAQRLEVIQWGFERSHHKHWLTCVCQVCLNATVFVYTLFEEPETENA